MAKPIKTDKKYVFLKHSKNILDYRITPKDSVDKSGLMFSDQGAWYAYSFAKTENNSVGFSGPFLMTQENGIWSSKCLTSLFLSTGSNKKSLIDFNTDLVSQNSYSSHLEQLFKNKNIELQPKISIL